MNIYKTSVCALLVLATAGAAVAGGDGEWSLPDTGYYLDSCDCALCLIGCCQTGNTPRDSHTLDEGVDMFPFSAGRAEKFHDSTLDLEGLATCQHQEKDFKDSV